MTRAALLAALALAGCQTARTVATPVVSCSDARFSDRSAHMAADLDEPPEPVGGLDAVASRVRLSPEGGPRIARAEDRYAVVRAAVDTTGAVFCSDVVEASSVGRGEAAQRAVHASAFTPGRDGGQPVAAVIDLRVQLLGGAGARGVPRVVTGEELRGLGL